MSAGVGTGAGIGLNSNTWSIGEEMFKNDYYVYILEQVGGDFLRNRIDGEWWINDTQRVFNLFSGTVVPKAYTGKSYYGTSDTGWVSITANYNQGWWGCGFYNYTPAFNLVLTNDYKFHIAFRATQNNPFKITLAGAGASTGSFTVGATGDPTPYTFDRDGRWHSIEVTLSTLAISGLIGQGTMSSNTNYLLIENAGGGGGTFDLDVDAAYWYNTQGVMP